MEKVKLSDMGLLREKDAKLVWVYGKVNTCNFLLVNFLSQKKSCIFVSMHRFFVDMNEMCAAQLEVLMLTLSLFPVVGVTGPAIFYPGNSMPILPVSCLLALTSIFFVELSKVFVNLSKNGCFVVPIFPPLWFFWSPILD